jgi:hypothetical protein
MFPRLRDRMLRSFKATRERENTCLRECAVRDVLKARDSSHTLLKFLHVSGTYTDQSGVHTSIVFGLTGIN